MTAPMLLGLVGLGLLYTIATKFLGGGKGPVFLNKERQQVALAERTMLSPDTIRFRFALPQKNSVLGLPVGKHFKLFAPNPKGKVPGQWNGRDDPEADATEIERKYTPTSSDHDLGYVDLVIKVRAAPAPWEARARCCAGCRGWYVRRPRPPFRACRPKCWLSALPPSPPLSGLRGWQGGSLPRRRQDVAVPRLAQGGRQDDHLGPVGHERVQGRRAQPLALRAPQRPHSAPPFLLAAPR